MAIAAPIAPQTGISRALPARFTAAPAAVVVSVAALRFSTMYTVAKNAPRQPSAEPSVSTGA